MSDGTRDISFVHDGDFPLTVECRTCGKCETLYFNGGELDESECCGWRIWVEAFGYIVKTRQVKPPTVEPDNPYEYGVDTPSIDPDSDI